MACPVLPSRSSLTSQHCPLHGKARHTAGCCTPVWQHLAELNYSIPCESKEGFALILQILWGRLSKHLKVRFQPSLQFRRALTAQNKNFTLFWKSERLQLFWFVVWLGCSTRLWHLPVLADRLCEDGSHPSGFRIQLIAKANWGRSMSHLLLCYPGIFFFPSEL